VCLFQCLLGALDNAARHRSVHRTALSTEGNKKSKIFQKIMIVKKTLINIFL
jgi:hypothetical protein